MSVLIELKNKLRLLSIFLNSRPFKRFKSPADYLEVIQELDRNLQGSKPKMADSRRLWFLEKLVKEARTFENSSFLLKDPKLEKYKAILHVGWGMDVFFETGFNHSDFEAIVNKDSDRRYRLLVLEPIGVVFVACQCPFQSKMMGLKTPPLPKMKSLNGFFGNYKREEMQMISHGLGRGIIIKEFTLNRAMRTLNKYPPWFDLDFVLQGIGFAYTMINLPNLNLVLKTANQIINHGLQKKNVAAFNRGIVSALGFLEWHISGFLESVQHPSFREQGIRKMKTQIEAGGIFKL